ncbi:MAG TPA: hypothetical protein VKK31_14720 [Thermoanaerobaculia bacterium]|nr:hypothetical protein [Thermoanaerobaculia bacterium]
MVRKTKEQLLNELRRKKTNRTLPEVEELLEAYGFTYRPGSKERGGIWQRGRWTLTLPKPHGGDRALAPKYIGKLIDLIELAEAEELAERSDRQDG